MTRAQAAWTYLSALFLVAAVVLRLVDPSTTGYALTCMFIAVFGWLVVGGMIMSDRKPVEP